MDNIFGNFMAKEKEIYGDANYERNIEQAKENILKAGSAQNIMEFIKQDDPKHPSVIRGYHHEALVRLVADNIMKHFSHEEIAHVVNLSSNPEKHNEYVSEYAKLSKKLGDDTSRSFFEITAVNEFESNNVMDSVQITISKHIKKYPQVVEDIYDEVLPNIQQDKKLLNTQQLLKALTNGEKERYESRFSNDSSNDNSNEIEIARKAGYVQGVCECVAAIGEDRALGKKLLTEMNVNRDMAKKFANPETFKTLEQGIFAQKQEQTLEQTQSFTR
ncbi:hypothetical protein R84B8_01834 [Treponema sp. R8-4-B8]